MSNETITLQAQKRDILGKQVRQLRGEGKTPAVVHDHGKDSLHIVVEERDLKKVYSQAGKHHPVELKVGDKKYTTLIKEVTHKPASAIVFHTVFQAVSANETVKAEIPVQLTGEIPAEKKSLLVLQNTDSVEVEAIPSKLVDVLEVDASGLEEAGDKLTVADLTAPEGLVILTDPETMIATVEVPKDQIAEADAAAEALAEDAGTPEEGETDAEGASTEPESGAEAEAGESQPSDESKK